MLHLKEGIKKDELEGCTAIIPSFSIVNASQLALDILISSKKLERIGILTNFSLVPVYGYSAFSHNPQERSASCEIYANLKEKLLVIQFRTVLVQHHAGAFHKKLSVLLHDIKVKRVIIMSTAINYGLEDVSFQYQATDSFLKAHQTDLDKMHWRENKQSEVIGGGNDKLLYKACDQRDLPVMIFYRILSNPTDAMQEEIALHQVIDLVVNFLKIGKVFSLVLPIGWHSVVNNEGAETMY